MQNIKKIKTNIIYKLDQFFTKKEVAEFCLQKLKKIYNFDQFDFIVEPSAGTGSFFNLLPKDKRVAIELDDVLCEDNSEYIHKSFLDYNDFDKNKNILVIGNPPFGTQNKLSVDFFNHAATFANIIAFIIPKTWKKQSIHNRLDERFVLDKSIDLPEDCFDGSKITNVKCCFQIWKRSSKKRVKRQKSLIHKDWDFLPYIKKNKDLFPPHNADFVLLAYGSNPGQISQDLYNWRPKSVHFIKSNISKKILIDRFNNLDYSCANNSARQSSLCKTDLVNLYVKKFGK